MRTPILKSFSELKTDVRPDDRHQVYISGADVDIPPNLLLITKSILEPKKTFDWHKHIDFDEIFIVVDGHGLIHFENGETLNFSTGDLVNCPSGLAHKIENTSDKQIHFYFIRVKN